MYSKEIRNEVMKKVNSGIPVSAIAKEFNISLPTIYNWKKQLENEKTKKIEIISLEQQELYDDEYFEKYVREIKNLIKNRRLLEALQLCEENHTLDNFKVQLQRIIILIKLDRIEEALEICNIKKFENHPHIQLQKIRIFVKIENYKCALEICEKRNFLKNSQIQEERLNILLQFGRLKEALELCNMNIFSKNDRIKKLASKISDNLRNDKYVKDSGYILTKIYCDDISLEEIELAELDSFEKILLTVAYYEKYDRKKGIKFIKDKKVSYGIGNKLKTLNILLERLLNKKTKFFDLAFYENYLKCSIDFNLVSEISNRKEKNQEIDIVSQSKKVEKITSSKVEQIKTKKVENAPKMIVSEGKRVTSRHLVNNIEKQSVNKNEELLIKDLFEEELLEIGKYLYIKMGDLSLQNQAIEAWDKLEYLASQPVTDKDKLKRMISLIERLNGMDGLKLSVNEKRYSKYLK